jgi:hypothetical protein
MIEDGKLMNAAGDAARHAIHAGIPRVSAAANAALVNRTHRVVRERAKEMKARRSRARSLWIPMGICSALLIILCTAVWTALANYDMTPTDVPDSSDQLLILLVWFFPVSAFVLAMVWFRRSRTHSNDEVSQ